jgi:hypothetical protein
MATSTQEPNDQPKKKKGKASRAERFHDAAQTLIDAIDDLKNFWEENIVPVNDAIQELKDLQEEYQSWYDSLPEGLQQGATGEKLEIIVGIEVEEIEEPDFDTLENAAQECLDADTPIGFGRD